MPRPFLEKVREPEYWLEQSGHGWIGFAAGFPVATFVFWASRSGFWAFIAAVSASALAAIARELWQNLGDDDNDIADAILDTFMTWAGGILTGLPWLVVGLV